MTSEGKLSYLAIYSSTCDLMITHMFYFSYLTTCCYLKYLKYTLPSAWLTAKKFYFAMLGIGMEQSDKTCKNPQCSLSHKSVRVRATSHRFELYPFIFLLCHPVPKPYRLLLFMMVDYRQIYNLQYNLPNGDTFWCGKLCQAAAEWFYHWNNGGQTALSLFHSDISYIKTSFSSMKY